MKTYRVEVAVKTCEYYEVQAADEKEARTLWLEGKLIHTGDELDCTILAVEEIESDQGGEP